MDNQMQFYLPNFEDLVDPEYDFETDTYSPKRKNRWKHDRNAHEFFDANIFDGMLVSKAVVRPAVERHIREAGGIHALTRLNPHIPIMGDCGAFTYVHEEKPIFSVQDVLNYYNEFGFDYGVSLDHLAYVTVESLENALERGRVKSRWWSGKTDEQLREERIQISLDNAREFLQLCEVQKPRFKPIGIAQGGTPEMFHESVAALINMGYNHIALGGLVRSPDTNILAILHALQPLRTSDLKLHVFGVARLSLVQSFVHLGVTSADSASPIRRAFLGTGEDNYWSAQGPRYAAIRVPQTKSNYTKRGVDSMSQVLERNEELTETSLLKLEQKALRLLRAYDRDEVSLDETLETVLSYDKLYGVKRDYESAYRRTLQDRPWKECGCAICRTIGIEVVIFRGNNRNRRRGFHNVRVFYEQFRRVVTKVAPSARDGVPTQEAVDLVQLPLGLLGDPKV
jgi:hypothetical protein